MRALESALRIQSRATLAFRSIAQQRASGFLVSGDDRTIMIELETPVSDAIDKLADQECEVVVHGERQFRFLAIVTAVPAWGERRVLGVSRPSEIEFTERRRFLRAKPAPSSTVELTWRDANATHRCRAALLNISADGMACRVEDSTAAVIGEGGASLQTEFRLPGRAEPFRMDATIMNRTPASPGHTILGLQFVRSMDAAGQVAALKQLLETHLSAQTHVEIGL